MPAADIKKNTAGELTAAARILCIISLILSLNVIIVFFYRAASSGFLNKEIAQNDKKKRNASR